MTISAHTESEVKQMTKQEAIEILRDTPIDIRSTREDDIHTLYATAQGMAIEALQYDCEKVAEGCDDYITVKRQFVLDAINIGLSGYISDDDILTLEGMGIAVSDLPSAQPERKKGEWIPYEFGDESWHQCTACGVADKYIDYVKGYDGKTGKLVSVRNYCPYCGADMRGEQE